MARKNKSKKEIVHDIKAVQETDRKRRIVRDTVYPFLLELNETIGYTKIFLQTASTGLENTFHEKQREIKVSELLPRLREIFAGDEKNRAEMEKYIKLFELLKDETVYGFITMIQFMPKVIEQYFTKETDKHPVLDVPIDKILG